MKNKFQILNEPCNNKAYKDVDWDNYEIGEGNELLGTTKVGHCLAITLYNPQNKKGVLVHLTNYPPEELKPENVVETLLHQLNGSRDLNYQELEATLSGEWDSIFEQKSTIVKKRINDYGIPIIGEDLGGERIRRAILLNCDNGNVEVYRT